MNYEAHEYANLFPLMNPEERAGLIDDMKRSGYDTSAPIVIHEGKILDGRNRYEAARDAEVAPTFTNFEGGDALAFVVRHNLKRRHLNESQRAVIAGRLANMTRGGTGANQYGADVSIDTSAKVSIGQAADMLNVGRASVARVRAVERDAPELVEFLEAGALTANAAQKIAQLPEQERAPILEEIRQGNKPHVTHNSGENEWYTPAVYIEAARRVMGRIDIDPASSEVANRTVMAGAYYDKQANGLEKIWAGNIWMNPPYSGDLIGKFCDKLKSEYEQDRITAAIVLVNNATETNWFYTLAGMASAVVFTKGRVKFLDPKGIPSGAPLQGQAIVYIGDNPELFLAEFSGFGWGAICAGK